MRTFPYQSTLLPELVAHFADLTAAADVETLSSRHGDGVSRPMPGEDTQLYTLRVAQSGVAPMRVCLYAESAQKALAYGSARWPEAKIALLV